MENQVEKMYENAGIKTCKRKQGFTLKDCTDRDCKECGYYIMPPFTAEKQIELIKWLTRREPKVEIGYFGDQLGNALAGLINNLWQDLTKEEKQQIKEILE